MVIFLTCLVIFLLIVNITGFVFSGPAYRGPVTDHFNGRRFINPTGIKARGPRDVFKWMYTRKRGAWVENKTINFGEKPFAKVDDGVRITFINHSTFLIQVDGLNILTDPVWSERTSPFSFMGPKRMRQPGIAFDDLPKIDVVLLSHNHYDHLDLPTVKKIADRHKPKIITPLGVKAFLEKNNIPGEVDLDWWSEYDLTNTIKIQATPAQHFSGRGTYDRDATLWCGYVIKRSDGNIYFAGDTGYNIKTFNEIGERCHPIKIALIPIGAYKPQWFMSPIHCSPEEAVQIHKEIKSELSIATHFGTFPLADDSENDPKDALTEALKNNSIEASSFIILPEGEGRTF
ncbi:MAG TPA: MBL fold metallo-hydrolase [Cyclobacteriaceae bacterium]